MPAVHDQPVTLSRPPVAPRHTPWQQVSDWEVQSRQLAAHLLNDLGARRLPELLAIREQVQSGEPLTLADRACLTGMFDIFDRAAYLLIDDRDVHSARENIVQLCDEIFTRASPQVWAERR